MPILFKFSVYFIAIISVEVYGKATFADCGGPDKKIEVKQGGVKPDPILYPGNVSVSASLEVLADLPSSDFSMNLHLTKLEPKRMAVPCLQNIGSCEYDVCEMIQNHQKEFCPMFPPQVKCGCPLKKASYSLKDALVVIPDFGEIFAKILQGGYEGNITFTDKSSGTEVGCIAITFQIEPSKLL